MINDDICINILHMINPKPTEFSNTFFELANNITFYKNEGPIVSIKNQNKAMYIINRLGIEHAKKLCKLMNN